MDRECMDHYEKQLYSVFKTFDVDNEEALDKAAVLDLCDALQLEDRGAALVDTLFERPAERVTFSQFRNGLLSVLGAGEPAPPPPPPAPVAPVALPPPPPHSDDDSSGREVAPKFVFGSKKYGRRSRPHSAASASRAEPQSLASPDQDRSKRRMKCKRSTPTMDEKNISADSSTSDSRELDHDKQINYEESLALCHSLHMDRIDPQLIRQIFNEAPSNEISVGEFFDRLNTSLTMSIASTCDTSIAVTAPNDCSESDGWGSGSMISSDSVVDAWDNAGIEHSRQLLLELGFTSPMLRASDLSRALDEELRAFISGEQEAPDARALLLQAALALQRLRLARARRGADAAQAENAKLRNDLADANRRAQTLAQEVDENHARIESTLKGRIKQLEARHAEEMRAATAEWAGERERAAQTVARFEEAFKKVAAEEVRLRTDSAGLLERNEELSRRASLAEERAAELESARDALVTELKTMVEKVNEIEVGLDDGGVAELSGKLEELRLENKILRDRNDELCAELEAAARGGGDAAPAAEAASWREEAGLSRRASSQQFNDECDQSFVSIDQKVVGHLEAVRRLQGALDAAPAVEPRDCASCETLKGIISSIQERVQELGDAVGVGAVGAAGAPGLDAAAQTEPLEDFQKKLEEAERKHEEEKQSLTNLVRDLETSLEALKIEYEKCEEYWSSKLECERDEYREEQRISDERLNELISKISEYEQQFAPNTSGGLTTIDESLYESQVVDLQEELDKTKHDGEAFLAEKTKEIEDLKEKLKILEAKLEAKQNGHVSNSNVASPIDYLWNQGTITSPYKSEKRRDYHNPAFTRTQSTEEPPRPSSDGEREREPVVNPIQRPPRSASAGHMIHCAELEGQLRQQAQMSSKNGCACAALEARCRQLAAALRHRQMCLDAVQQAARSEGLALRARITAAEGGAARLQSRLAAADILVKELYLENCQLSHQTRLL